MTARHICLVLFSFFIIDAFSEKPLTPAIESYGSAKVTDIHRLDEHVRIYCDIAEFPPIIGQDIPVCIKGLRSADNAKDNLNLLIFLNDLLLPKESLPPEIMLKNIERGKQFCLIADIEINGQDLCDLLVEKKLGQKFIEVSQAEKKDSHSSKPIDESGYIATKSSKVFHRGSCQHAKRINKAKAVLFPSREEAEKTGRRPCKICKP